MGKWYVVEVIEHKFEGRPTMSTQSDLILSTQKLILDACPIVNINPLGHSNPPRIRLLWEEDSGDLEYFFWVLKTRGPGIWNSDIQQNGQLYILHCLDSSNLIVES